MAKLFIYILLMISFNLQLFCQVGVRGYYRKDGTYVRPHQRTHPDGNPYNNYSFPGNYNPNTGKVSPGNSQTYLDNYYRNGKSTNKSRGTYSTHGTNSTYNTTNSYLSGNNYSNYVSNNYYYKNTYYVNTNSLNVRTGPSTNHNILVRLNKLQKVQVKERYSNGWTLVEFQHFNNYSISTIQGYVFDKYLSDVNEMMNFNANTYNNHNNVIPSLSPNSYSNIQAHQNTQTYIVQIGATRSLNLNASEFKRINQNLNITIYYERGTDNIYRYYAGNYTTLQQAQLIQSKVRNLGIDCFIKPK